MSQYASYSGYIGGSGGGGGGGVSSLNSETGDINLVAGSGITILPVGQNITISASGASTENLEYHTITGGEATAKQFTMSATPLTANKTMCDIITGGPQNFGTDFTVSGNVFNWSGLALDGILSSGDIVRLHYLS
jgi:hypothetical protein